MTKYLRYKVAESDPMYCAIRDLAIDKLTGPEAKFSFDEVIEELNLRAWKDDIVWDRIVCKMIEAEGAELLGLNKTAFKKRKKPSEKIPAVQIAGPHGKLAGYANLCPDTEDLFLAKLDLEINQGNGMVKKAVNTAQRGIRKGITSVEMTAQRKILPGRATPQIEGQTNEPGTANTESPEDGTDHTD